MAFKPVRLTDPKGKLGDVVASHPVDYNNFLYRDGYVEAEDQSGLDDASDTADTGAVASEKAAEQTDSAPRTGAKAAPSPKTGEGKATNAAGTTVQTA